jgi:hypothetical protein
MTCSIRLKTGVALGILLGAAPFLSFAQLPAPTLISPSAGAEVTLSQVLNSQVLLNWTDVTGASEYEVDIQGPPGFINFLPRVTTSEIYFNRTSIPGDYWWRVRAFDAQSDPGIYSASRALKVVGRIDPTPSSTPGPTLTPTPHPASCFDLNSNDKIDAGDLIMLLQYFKDNDLRGDFSKDSMVSSEDIFLFSSKWKIEIEPR